MTRRTRPDNRSTIEVCWRSDGDGRIVPGPTAVLKVSMFVFLPNEQKWAKTESGDVWPCIPHTKPHVADFYALGGIPR